MRSLFVLIALFAGTLAVGVESQSELERRGRKQGKGKKRGGKKGRKLAAGLKPRDDPVDPTDFECQDEQTFITNWWNQECECMEMSLFICDGKPVWNTVTNLGGEDENITACQSVIAQCPFETITLDEP